MDRARRGVAVGNLVGARPAGLCLATAGEQADGRSGRGAHCGAVRPHGRSRARVRRPHHPAYVRINGEGALVYHGGIDDKPTARLEDLKSARNFVDQALSEISQGKPVSVTTSRAYGCSIKYGSFRGGILPNPRADGSKI